MANRCRRFRIGAPAVIDRPERPKWAERHRDEVRQARRTAQSSSYQVVSELVRRQDS